MKQQFRGYYQPSREQLDDLWSRGLIVLDTNALLNFYRYSDSTRSDFLSLLTSLTDRLWLPHQVGLEFHRNRLEVIDQQEQAFESIESALSKAQSLVEKELNGFRSHQSLNRQGIATTLETGLSRVKDTISESRRLFDESPIVDDGVDSVLVALTDLFDSRVGTGFSTDELSDIYAEGAERYEKSIPPGFKDKAKPEPERYGDLVLWREVLAKGRTLKLPVIFVTDDSKDDWWQNFKGRTMGPRVELVEEFYEATDQRIHFYTPERFLQYAKDRGGSPEIRAESIGEVQQVSEAPFRAVQVLSDRLQSLTEERRGIEEELLRSDGSSDSNKKPHKRQLSDLEAEARELKVSLEGTSQFHTRVRELIVVAEHEEDRRDLLVQLDLLDHQKSRLQSSLSAITKKIQHSAQFESSDPTSRSQALRRYAENLDNDIEKTVLAIEELQ